MINPFKLDESAAYLPVAFHCCRQEETGAIASIGFMIHSETNYLLPITPQFLNKDPERLAAMGYVRHRNENKKLSWKLGENKCLSLKKALADMLAIIKLEADEKGSKAIVVCLNTSDILPALLHATVQGWNSPNQSKKS
jgi:hypothetical protein